MLQIEASVRASFARVEERPWTFAELESAIAHAQQVCSRQASKVKAKITLEAKPEAFGPGPRPVVLLNLLRELADLTTLAKTITAWDLMDLLSTALQSLNTRRFRVAAMCTRTMVEELAYAVEFRKQLEPVKTKLFSFRDSEYRPRRFNELQQQRRKELVVAHLELRTVLLRRLVSQRISTNWSTAPAVRPKDYELPGNDPQRQIGALTFIDKVNFSRGTSKQTARSHYDQLCEATHPNQLARGMYYDKVTRTSNALIIEASRERASDELLDTAAAVVLIPLMESVDGLAAFVDDLEDLDRKLHRRTQLLNVLL